jgi:4-hydroxy-3-polyprenylbenzoate decarboxylase
VVVPRETPFSLIHLRNLTTLAEAGARIVPAIPAWYHQPQTIDDLVDFVVARALDQLEIDCVPLNRCRGICPTINATPTSHDRMGKMAL